MTEKEPYQLPAIAFLQSTMDAKKALEKLKINYDDFGEKKHKNESRAMLRLHFDSLNGPLLEAQENINSIIQALRDAFPAELESQGVA